MEQLNKGLTKHLYRMDEVLSSLRWSIINHNLHETAFWTLELYESNFIQECIETLETIWVYQIGFGSWFTLRLIQSVYDTGDINQENLVSLTCAFAKQRHCDSTIFHLLLRGAIEVNWKPAFPHSMEYSTVSEGVEDCLKRGKLQEAWLMGRAMSIEDSWKLLDKIANKLNRTDALLIIKELRPSVYERLALAYILVSLNDAKWNLSQELINNHIPTEVHDAINEWTNDVSMRKRRAIKPRSEALLYLTRRSEQTPYVSSEPEIQENLETTLLNSEYWSSILDHYMTNGSWKSDDHKESFYDTFFPDDIPDEWSVASREMSHGRGLGKSIEQARPRFIHHTLQRSKSLELWNSVFPSNLDCSMEWDRLYSVKPVIECPIKPLKKAFEIV